MINGFLDRACVALLWYSNRVVAAERAVGNIIGAYIAALGWRVFIAQVQA